MRAGRKRRRGHRLMQRVRREYLDQVEIMAQELLEAGRRVNSVFSRALGEQGRVALAERCDFRVRMAQITAHVQVEDPAEPNKADAQLASHWEFPPPVCATVRLRQVESQ